jgi:SPP1 gp7 family putative phage head morphogenesis protein
MPVARPVAVNPRTGLVGRVGRRGKIGLGTELLGAAANPQRLSHRARRRIASPPMQLVERVVAAVGSALSAWSVRFIDRVMASAPLPVKADASVRLDASVDELFAALDDPKVARELLERTFKGIDARSSDDLRVIGVQTSTVVPDAQRLQQEWISKSTDLIRATEDVKRRVKEIIEGPLVEGRTAADIRKLLEEQAGYARSRAELTARDQTLKLYGKIQEERQTAAGFTKYVWTTSLDERVREDHAELDGTVQSWDDPPIIDRRTGRRGHPGADFQCRCSAVPFADDDVIAQPDTEVQRDFQAEAEARAQARIEAELDRGPGPG